MSRGDIKQAYDRAVAHDVPDVADMLLKLTARIDQVENQLWHEQNLSFRNQLNEMQDQLAASQAREVTLRASFDQLLQATEVSNVTTSTLEVVCRRARMLPTDDTALREMIVKAGEVMRERCVVVLQGITDEYYDEEVSATWLEKDIIALPGVTLEDLQG